MILLDALEDLGYEVRLAGNDLRLTYRKAGIPDPARVTPLLEAIKLHKREAVEYLQRQADFDQLFQNSLREVDGAYEAGTIAHVRENYPVLWSRMVATEERLSEAWLAGKDDAVRKTANEWTGLNLEAIKIFRMRNTQRQLFGGGEK